MTTQPTIITVAITGALPRKVRNPRRRLIFDLGQCRFRA
jgi:hypothetical protein